MSALWPLQKAVASRLQADAALMARVTGIHDGRAPEAEPMPYIVIGEPTEIPFDTLGRAGYQPTLTIHVWSAQRGTSQEVNEIVALMDAALAAPLTLDGHTEARLRPEFRTVLVEDNGNRHAPVRYRAYTMEAA